LKVLYLITELDVGGAERNLCRLARGVLRSGHGVHVAALDGRGPLARHLSDEGIDVTDLGLRGKRGCSFFANLVRLLRSVQPDVLHTFLFHANLVGRLAAVFSRPPAVISAVRVAEKRRLSHLAGDWITQWLCDMEIAVSKSVEHFTRTRAFLPQRKLCTIPNSTDLLEATLDANALQREFPETAGGKVLMHVGRLDPQKGVDILLKAFALLLKRSPGTWLLLVGEGPQKEHLASLAARLGVARRVVFAGRRDNVGDLMSGATAVVLASRWEGMPNVLIEAAAVGKPVVATDVEGVREVVLDGRTGFVTKKGSIREFADACHKLLSDEALAVHMGAHARERAEELFSVDAMTRSTIRLYEKVLARKRRRRRDRSSN